MWLFVHVFFFFFILLSFLVSIMHMTFWYNPLLFCVVIRLIIYWIFFFSFFFKFNFIVIKFKKTWNEYIMSWEKFTLYILYSTSILSWKVIIVQHVTRNVPLRYECADLGLPCGLRGKCSSFTLCCSCSCFYCQVQPLDAALWQTLCLSYTRHLVIYAIR